MRALVIFNKWWECDPALAAMLSDNARPSNCPWPIGLKATRRPPELSDPNPHPEPRAIFRYKNFAAEVWCISDLLDGLPSNLQSSSARKFERLPAIFEGENPGLVISVGTASTPIAGVNCNGSVAVGTSVFMHNGFPNGSNPDSDLELSCFDDIVESSIGDSTFERIRRMDATSALNRFLPVPTNPGSSPDISIGFRHVALGTVNVTNSRDYAAKDRLTIQAFAERQPSSNPASLETTHGLIRIRAGESPFVFVSGIVNRFERFGTDVAPRADSQNTAGSHNAGVVVAWMLSSLDELS
jgi:hypothetical protein